MLQEKTSLLLTAVCITLQICLMLSFAVLQFGILFSRESGGRIEPSCVLSSNKDTWYSTMCRLWPEFMPLPLSDDDNHPCSFSAIFSDPFAASFYSLTWAEVDICCILYFVVFVFFR